MGIEPTFLAWEANVLPLNYTRMCQPFYGQKGGVRKQALPRAEPPHER